MKHPELQPPVREKKVKAAASNGAAVDTVEDTSPTDIPHSTADKTEDNDNNIN